MARYIDAEVFAERLLNAWDTADKEKKSDIVAILSDIVTPILVGTPTADVVPRAEVERDLHDLLNYIRLNEDISKKCIEENGEENREYFKGKLSAFLQIRGFIDVELKKKYTEGQK